MDKIIINQSGHNAVLTILSSQTDDIAEDLKKTLDSLIDDKVTQITLDVKQIHNLHTLALGAIVFAHRNITRVNGTLSLVNVTPELLQLFKTFGLEKVLNIS